MTKRNSSRNSTQQTRTSSEALAPGGSVRGLSHRPRGRVGRFLKKVKDKLRISRSKDSRSRSPVPPNVNHEGASSTSAASSAVEVTDTQLELRDAQESTKRMHPLAGPVITVASVGQGGQEDLDAVDNFQDTYLEPLRIFDNVIGKIADLHPYAKMALGVLSCAPKLF
ncbi:hypothetical protein DFJ58DRAFT_399683 [Suillus subalutaceus]|uniref:uncharacterized protein n=1 Tax=Suillus subalutaceus TaxID=48586 RepID=UPI001B863CC2|nr:uncharacterized protein DFJ58DRAFT_399683 [Suillus subalutaceus]KAG1852862.1 hypothetical protein DFJ58DRAFT_399683 [Suillus subalutaceus]